MTIVTTIPVLRDSVVVIRAFKAALCRFLFIVALTRSNVCAKTIATTPASKLRVIAFTVHSAAIVFDTIL